MAFKLFPGQPDAVVLFNPRNDARLLVQPEVARALEHCFALNSLSGHLIIFLMPCHHCENNRKMRCISLSS